MVGWKPRHSKLFQKQFLIIIKHRFQKAGIFPFCNTVIPIENYEPEAYKLWCTFKQKQADRAISTDVVTDATVVPTAITIVEKNPHVPATYRANLSESRVTIP